MSKRYCIQGYESHLDELRSYNKDLYSSLDASGIDSIVDKVYQIYSSINIFPIQLLSELDIENIIKECREYDARPEDDVLNCSDLGTELCKFHFNSMYHVYRKIDLGKRNTDPTSMFDRFHNERILKKAIRNAFMYYKDGIIPKNLFEELKLSRDTGKVYKPMDMKALYEEYCGRGGAVLDFSCGFGERMLAALTSNYDMKYVGLEPNSATYRELVSLGNQIEEVLNKEKSFRILNQGSESFCSKEGIFDFIFSAPPSFDLRVYSSESTQCYNRYSELCSWQENYVKQTIKNIFYMLKRDSYCAVSLSNFKINGKKYDFVDVWKKYSDEVGFEFYESLDYSYSSKRISVNESYEEGYDDLFQKVSDECKDKERVYVFYKG